MDLTPINRQYTNTSSAVSPVISGPLHFLKLAIQDLKVPFVYLRRTLRLSIATGASFRVQYFDVANQLSQQSREYSGQEYKRGQWLVSKHVPPPTPSLMEQKTTNDEAFEALRLIEISAELRVLAHEQIRRHLNVVDLIGFSWEKQSDELGRRWPFLVVENANCGSLATFFQNAELSQRTFKTGISLALDIANGLTALHGCSVIHGDLKPENILVFQYPDGAFCAKISDFGSAIILSDFAFAEDEPSSILLPAYTPPWEAPEAHHAIELADLPKVDVYAYGLLFCYLTSLGANIFEKFQQTTQLGTREYRHDLNAIANLKRHYRDMINHAIYFVTSKTNLDSTEADHINRVVGMTLHAKPSERDTMLEVLNVVVDHGNTMTMNLDFVPVPPLAGDDPSSDDMPEYQDIGRWDRDLMRAARLDIVASWRHKISVDRCSKDPVNLERAAQNMFWLSKWALSKWLGPITIDESLSWLLEAAEMGSQEARSTVFNVFAALGQSIPSNYESELESWLIDACERDEHPAQSNLKELYPESYPRAIQSLRTIYCGYGQDCFGESWRNQYPLNEFKYWIAEVVENARDIDELHKHPGLVCGMAWLHYAGSSGRLDIVRQLVNHGANANILNDYGETSLFMACQAGHHEVAKYLCLLTRRDVQDYSTFTELHFLDKFDEERMNEMAQMLLQWGADIDSTKGERGQTPLANILNRNSPNCTPAMLILLRLGGDPTLKDDNGLDCVAHAACNLSVEQLDPLLRIIPQEHQSKIKANALRFLLEMDECELLVRGGKTLFQKLENTIGVLFDSDSSHAFEQQTYHPAFTFGCAKAPIQAVKILAKICRATDLDRLIPSGEEWYSPMIAAVVQDRPHVVEYLLQTGVDCTPTVPEIFWTPLFYAVSGSPQMVASIVETVESSASHEAAVAYVNHRDDLGCTAFDIAVSGEFFEAASILWAYKPDFLAFTLRYSESSSAFYNLLGQTCYMADQLLYLLSLLQDHTEILEVDNEGVTLLHAVCGVPIDRAPKKESERIVNAVVSRFPTPESANLRSKAGETPLHYAARFGNFYALQKLDAIYSEYLDWRAVQNNGWTALDEAESRDFQDIEEMSYPERALFQSRTREVVSYLLEKGVTRSGNGVYK